MTKLLNVPWISQLGYGADIYNNDCGPACCSMVVAALKGDIVSPNEWYKMDGWGKPTTDIGTYAYQLQAALNLFEIESMLDNVLSLYELQTYINAGRLIIPLVDYGVFSDAGLTQIKGHFGHWFLVIGYDEWNIITLDPYRTISGIMAVPNDLFVKAYLNSCLVTVQGIVNNSETVMARFNELTLMQRHINSRRRKLKVII